eukprot:scaffold5079_cov169-Amphora_coffeaeformis.AAC.3
MMPMLTGHLLLMGVRISRFFWFGFRWFKELYETAKCDSWLFRKQSMAISNSLHVPSTSSHLFVV